jgi:hypothetical protein
MNKPGNQLPHHPNQSADPLIADPLIADPLRTDSADRRSDESALTS